MMRFSYQLNVFTQNLLTIIINCSTKIKLEENSTKELQDSSPPVDLQDFVYSRFFHCLGKAMSRTQAHSSTCSMKENIFVSILRDIKDTECILTQHTGKHTYTQLMIQINSKLMK